jgi:alkylation response protein AidB-like acyl-CoA dehydrogenase
MNLDWSIDDRRFVEEVRDFLSDSLTEDLRQARRRMTSVYSPPEVALAWQAILHGRGWAAPAWPVEYGGCGWDSGRRYLFARELAAAGAPPLSPMGLAMCGPVLIGHGRADQKAHFLPRILSGEDYWCQGYSERGAGSDLASLQMRAEEDGEDFVLNGHKIWTTHAHAANWMFCLVRTSVEDIPQKGITFLLLSMKSPGVTVRPIRFLSGEAVQGEVFFDDVRVPKSQAVGAIGKGWTVAKYLLSFERGGGVAAPGLRAGFERLCAAARKLAGDEALSLIDEAAVRAELADLAAEIAAFEASELRIQAALSGGREPGPEASMQKTLSTTLSQRITHLATVLAGPYAPPHQPHVTTSGGIVEVGAAPRANAPIGPEAFLSATDHYFNDRAGSIYAGSNEIQRNIIAKAVLGL